MKPIEECRTLEVKQGETWVPAHWEQLEEGDIIRMFEPASSNGVRVPIIFENKYSEAFLLEKPFVRLDNPAEVEARKSPTTTPE